MCETGWLFRMLLLRCRGIIDKYLLYFEFLNIFWIVLMAIMFTRSSSGTPKWTSWIWGYCSSVCLWHWFLGVLLCCCAWLGCVRPAAAQTSLNRTLKLSDSWSTVQAVILLLGCSCSWGELLPWRHQCGSCFIPRSWISDMTTFSLMGLLYMYQ